MKDNTLPEDFDWEFYLNNYPDIINAGLKTENDAKRHYLNHGISENRVYKKELKERKIIIKEENLWESFIKICKDLIPYLPNDFPIINKNSYKKSLIVETRKLEHNEFVIKNTIQKLGDGWGHIIYCHDNNYEQIKLICNDISSDIEIRLVEKDLDRNDYNNLLLDINFWNEINCEKILIYQTDTFILKDFNDDFLNYDYLGANWGPGTHMDFLKEKLNIETDLTNGNGGLSIRNIKNIKNSLKDDHFKSRYLKSETDINLDTIPEDVYFSLWNYLKKGKMKKDCSDFSIEPSFGHKEKLNFNEIPFAFHKLYDFDGWEFFIEKFKLNLRSEKQIHNISKFTNDNYKVLKNHNIKSCKVSVIISLYNYEKYIDRAIESVLNSDFKDFEIVIVNDCSTDNSLQVILPYLEVNKNITIVDKNINTGLSHTRNLGIDVSLGEYVFILDADNEIYENCLSSHFTALKDNCNLVACYSVIECFNENDIKVNEISNKEFIPELLKTGNYIDAMAMFNKKKMIEIGKYDTEMLKHGYGWEDYELWLKIAKENLQVEFLGKPLSKYYIKNKSMINETNLYFINENVKYLNEKYKINLTYAT